MTEKMGAGTGPPICGRRRRIRFPTRHFDGLDTIDDPSSKRRCMRDRWF
jgi:hypothetical protein